MAEKPENRELGTRFQNTAFWEALRSSSSNLTEHRISVFCTVRSKVVFDFIGLFGRPLNFGSPNPPIDLLKWLQFDSNYVF
jgi:hypothetical protein